MERNQIEKQTVEYYCPNCKQVMAAFYDVQEGDTRHVCWECRKSFRIYEMVKQEDA